MPEAGHRSRGDRLAIDRKTCCLDFSLPVALTDFSRIEPRDTRQSAKHQTAVGQGPRGTVAELIALQTVVGIIVVGLARLWIQTEQTVVGSNPKVALLVWFDAADAIVLQTTQERAIRLVARLHVITLKTVVGTYIQVTVELA